MATPDETVSITTPAEIEKDAPGVVRRWLAELTIAHREEKDWREEGKKLWEMYEGGKKKAHSFNILWANTELLLPAVYNSTPEPDVRRRFRDADPVGKAVSELLERALSSQVDEYDFDDEAESFVLDMLLVGRGVPRVKYVPTFAPQQMGEMEPGEDEQAEKLTGESVECETVQWDDFRLDVAGLPANFLPLFAGGRTAFMPEGEQAVVHGGIAVEELIVPFIKVGSER